MRREPATPGQRWRPTAVHERAVTGSFFICVAAIALHRPDLVVIAFPLAAAAVWGTLRKPQAPPSVEVLGGDGDLLEGQSVAVRVRTTAAAGAETVGHVLGVGTGLAVSPEGHVGLVDDDGEHLATFAVRPTRWGPTELGTGELHVRSVWGAFDSRWQRAVPLRLSVGPAPGAFSADGPVPHPSTLLGLHTGHRPGDGAEFNAIREFRPGDRPRHVHWRTSARTGRLHVRTSLAENDAEVVLLLDAFGNVPGTPDDSITGSVRAAASVAAWCTRNGDRVGLRVVGAQSPPVLAGTGHRQLLRILGVLARVVPSTDRFPDDLRLRLSLTPGSLVVILSSLTERILVATAIERARAGLDVIVVDTAPESFSPNDDVEALAWQVLRLERDRTIAALRRHGVAVTPWRGPGTLDAVLTGLTRRRGGAR